MQRAIIYLSLFFTALPFTSHAQQQPRTLEATKGQAWQHQISGITIPSEIIGLPRTKISDYSDHQLNIMVGYGNQRGSEVFSLYIFQPAIKSSPIWHDRAQTSIELAYFQSQPNTPRSAKLVSLPSTPDIHALLTIYQFPDGEGRRSTGLATVEVNGWIIKARFTSATLTIDAMEQRLTEMIARFTWPEVKRATAPAAFIEPCLTRMEWADADLSAKDHDQGHAIADAYFTKFGDFLTSEPLPMPVGSSNSNTPSSPKRLTFCRSEAHSTHSIYRPVDSTDRYILALGDAGKSMNVSRSEGTKSQDYRASYSDYSETYILPRFKSLPTPQQVVNLVNEGNFPSKVDSMGHITVFVPKDKD